VGKHALMVHEDAGATIRGITKTEENDKWISQRVQETSATKEALKTRPGERLKNRGAYRLTGSRQATRGG